MAKHYCESLTMDSNLPLDKQLDIGALSRLFSSTTNSYKLLFFMAILDSLQESLFKENKIRVNGLIIGMLRISFAPAKKFKLSFGSQDQIHFYIDEILSHSNQPEVTKISDTSFKKTIKQDLYKSSAIKLGKYVPYRLLQPFFEDELRGQKDAVKNKITENLAAANYDVRLPLYRIVDDYAGTYVELHPKWMEYIHLNFPILNGWVEVNWIKYLQSRNPNTPAILNKIHSYAKRNTLTKQRSIWKEYLNRNASNCIFSQVPITLANHDLDHFIPWNYIGHDQHWNLIPVLSAANSSKNDSLPSQAYINLFVARQRDFFEFCYAQNKKNAIEDYVVGLSTTANKLIESADCFNATLAQVVSSQLEMAKIQGFRANWKYMDS
ncbi:hypothetical protein FCV82_00035 [Vibrio breoganii]|nr:hypothetical protein BCT59_13715 [Vibrio breoganii]PMO63478.1 hypothetical protein BCT04_15780 [Vibrio breoganii]TKF91251.1 hypothetical protein FCV82_00035 [Vibrio breoganii]